MRKTVFLNPYVYKCSLSNKVLKDNYYQPDSYAKSVIEDIVEFANMRLRYGVQQEN